MSPAIASSQGASRRLTAEDFDNLMQYCGDLGDAPRVAVAVSGGPDSIALTHLLHQWLTKRGGTLFAITIDHQLRDESAREAAQVAQWCQAKHIAHTTLKWEKEKAPTSALHQHARNARYGLLMDACRAQNITHLFLGHHADDQAETVLMRFLKGSGVDGLAAMPSTRVQDGITLVRPLLPVQKHMLEATCAANGWAFVRDPSNDSAAYLRGRLRALAEPLAAEGVTTASLYDMARSAGMARAVLEARANEWLQQHAVIHPLGYIHIDFNAWKNSGDEMMRRALIRTLLCMSGDDYAPKSASIEYLMHNLLTKEAAHQTLCGCHINVQFGLIKFYREHAALPKAMRFEDGMLWDNRFKIVVNSAKLSALLDKNVTIAALGEASRDQLEKMGYKQVAECAALHRMTLPAIYVDNQLHSLPDFTADGNSQALAKAIFLPKRLLLSESFNNCPPLLT